MALSKALERAIMEHVYAGVPLPAFDGQTIKVILMTAVLDPTGVTEYFDEYTQVTGGGYAPQSVQLAVQGGAGAETHYASTSAVIFPNMPATTVVAVGLMADTNPDMLLHYDFLPAPYVVASGDSLSLGIGDITISMS